MGTRGGRRSTSYTPTWKNGKTQTIRVPIALAEQILSFAKKLDEQGSIEVTQAKSGQQIDALDAILAEINTYIQTNQFGTGANQYKRKGELKNIDKCRDWKHLLKFKRTIEVKKTELVFFNSMEGRK